MCGIAGIFHPDVPKPVDPARVEAMADVLAHRGPDGSGVWTAPGIGLAATQVDVHKRVIVIDISEARDQLHVFINPEILEASGEADCEEGCLSVPGIYEKVRRAERVKVRALDAEGHQFGLEAEGLLAVCVQHEKDHLEGKVFVDYLSRLKRQRIIAKLNKQARQAM